MISKYHMEHIPLTRTHACVCVSFCVIVYYIYIQDTLLFLRELKIPGFRLLKLVLLKTEEYKFCAEGPLWAYK